MDNAMAEEEDKTGTSQLHERSNETEDAKHDHEIIYFGKIQEPARVMHRNTLRRDRSCPNMLVWAIPALILHKVAGEEQLHKTHHSRAARLRQRLAAAEKRRVGSSHHEILCKKQKEMEQTMRSNQLLDKPQSYFRKTSRALYKANNGCLGAAKQITMKARKLKHLMKRRC